MVSVTASITKLEGHPMTVLFDRSTDQGLLTFSRNVWGWFWCIHAKCGIGISSILTRYFGNCQFFLRYCGIGYPPMPPSLKITTLPSGPLFEACLHNTTCHHLCRECATRDGEIQATLKQPFYVLLYYLNVFISRLGMIVRVSVVLNRTVVDSGCLPLTTNSRKFLLRCKW